MHASNGIKAIEMLGHNERSVMAKTNKFTSTIGLNEIRNLGSPTLSCHPHGAPEDPSLAVTGSGTKVMMWLCITCSAEGEWSTILIGGLPRG